MTTVASRSARDAGRATTPTREVIRFCVLAYLALRVATLVAALVAHAFPTLLAQGVPGWPAPPVHPGWDGVFSAFERFDALWFLRIADSGYRVGDGSAAFFPLLPLVTRALSFVLGGHPLAAGTIVSNVAFVGALVAIFRLGEEVVGASGARFGVLFLCAFPTAYFFVMPYSESVFLLCAANSILAARRERWALAALLGALAALTRSVGIVLAPALLFEALQQRGEGRRSRLALAACIAPALGTAAYAAWLGLGQRGDGSRHGGLRGGEHPPLVGLDGAGELSPSQAAADHRRWRREQWLSGASLEAWNSSGWRMRRGWRSRCATSRRGRASGTRSSIGSSRSSARTGAASRW